MEKLFGQFDPELLKQLARILRDNDLGELTLEDGDKKLTIKGKKPAPMPAPMGMPPVCPPAAPQEDAPTAPAAVSGTWVKAPLVGTYYAAPSPESEPFVTVGKRVKKGDVLLDRCVSVRYSDGVKPMTDEEKAKIKAQNKAFSENGLRVLSFAYKESDEVLGVDTEYGFTFLGLVSMVDPPRPESVAAVADARRAGIKPVMITGDHKITAVAIAKQIGIYEDGDMALTGEELDALSDEELARDITKISVYARVSPENKIRIVDAWQKNGNIVAMTGDGVNDAPALKKADIGVAMGITGTEVSKDAAAMILSDDNFATIIKAVSNGRNVYRNIKNAILFLLSGNTAGILAVLYTSIAALPVPFAPVHLLFINLLTDSLPALAIGMEPADLSLLSEKPRDPKKGILTSDFMAKMLSEGLLIAIATMTAFHLGLPVSSAKATTMAFATLTLARLFHGFNCRSEESMFKLGFRSNKYSVYAFLAGVAFLAAVLFIPGLHSLFSVVSLGAADVLKIAGLAFAPTAIIQIIKVIQDKRR